MIALVVETDDIPITSPAMLV